MNHIIMKKISEKELLDILSITNNKPIINIIDLYYQAHCVFVKWCRKNNLKISEDEFTNMINNNYNTLLEMWLSQ